MSRTVTIGNVGTVGFHLVLQMTTSTNALARALVLVVAKDANPSDVFYDAPLADAPSSLVIEYLPAGASSTFTFTLRLPLSAGNVLQDQSARLDLIWVGQS